MSAERGWAVAFFYSLACGALIALACVKVSLAVAFVVAVQAVLQAGLIVGMWRTLKP